MKLFLILLPKFYATTLPNFFTLIVWKAVYGKSEQMFSVLQNNAN